MCPFIPLPLPPLLPLLSLTFHQLILCALNLNSPTFTAFFTSFPNLMWLFHPPSKPHCSAYSLHVFWSPPLSPSSQDSYYSHDLPPDSSTYSPTLQNFSYLNPNFVLYFVTPQVLTLHFSGLVHHPFSWPLLLPFLNFHLSSPPLLLFLLFSSLFPSTFLLYLVQLRFILVIFYFLSCPSP